MAVTEHPRTILSLDEAKAALRFAGTDEERQQEIADLCAGVTLAFERECSREFVPSVFVQETPGLYLDEYHDLAVPQGFLQLRVYPVTSVTAVFLGQESSEALDVSAFVFDHESGQLSLRNSTVAPLGGASALGLRNMGSISGWPSDFPEDLWRFGGRFFPPQAGGGRVQYVGGFRNKPEDSWDGPVGMPEVPADLKMLAAEVVAKVWRTRERKGEGAVQEIAQGFSIATKFDQSFLNSGAKGLFQEERLSRFRNRSRTARR